MLISQTDSLLFQSLTMCRLLFELHQKNFLESDFYNERCFQNDNGVSKKILSLSGGIGNPATLQTMLYLLLVCPRESLDDKEKNKLDNAINDYFKKLDPLCYSTHYRSDKTAVDFSRHLRNAIAHSSCEYPAAGKMIFKDINPKNKRETFEIKIDSYKVEQLLELLQKLIIEFLNERCHPEK